MLRELAEAFDVIAAERPLVFVLEDLQWADASTTDIAILAALAKQNDGKLEVIDFQYDESFWGIGLAKTEDKTFCKWINTALNESISDGSCKRA